MGVTARRFQLDDRISDELARTMVGDVSPAPGLADGDPLPFELLPSDQEVALARCPAESDDRIVLEQDEGVLDELLATRPGAEIHLLDRLVVADPAWMDQLADPAAI